MMVCVWLIAGCAEQAGKNGFVRMSGKVPKDWPAEMPGLVAVPWDSAEPTGSAIHVELHIEGRSEPEEVVGQYERADPLADTPARVWFIWTAQEQDLGKHVHIVCRPVEQGKDFAAAYGTRRDGHFVKMTDGLGAPILDYWYGEPDPALPLPLNDFIHPLVGLDGEILTDCRPADHVHHRGLFWAWVRHEIEGQSVGSWWIPRGIHVQPLVLAMHDGAVFSSIAARHHWICTKDGTTQPFMDELVFARVYKTLPEGRALDVEIVFSAMVNGVRMGGTLDLDKGYGGLTLRFAKASEPLIESDGGRVEGEVVNHLRANWVDWSGFFARPGPGGAPARSGVAILIDPSHPDRPPEWITRTYGVLNVSYPGLEMLDMPVDQPLRLRYRLWIHRGDAAEGKVAEQYAIHSADWGWSPVRGSFQGSGVSGQ